MLRGCEAEIWWKLKVLNLTLSGVLVVNPVTSPTPWVRLVGKGNRYERYLQIDLDMISRRERGISMPLTRAEVRKRAVPINFAEAISRWDICSKWEVLDIRDLISSSWWVLNLCTPKGHRGYIHVCNTHRISWRHSIPSRIAFSHRDPTTFGLRGFIWKGLLLRRPTSFEDVSHRRRSRVRRTTHRKRRGYFPIYRYDHQGHVRTRLFRLVTVYRTSYIS